MGPGNIFRLQSADMLNVSVCGKKPDTLSNIICLQTNRIILGKLYTNVLHLWTTSTLVEISLWKILQAFVFIKV